MTPDFLVFVYKNNSLSKLILRKCTLVWENTVSVEDNLIHCTFFYFLFLLFFLFFCFFYFNIAPAPINKLYIPKDHYRPFMGGIFSVSKQQFNRITIFLREENDPKHIYIFKYLSHNKSKHKTRTLLFALRQVCQWVQNHAL